MPVLSSLEKIVFHPNTDLTDAVPEWIHRPMLTRRHWHTHLSVKHSCDRPRYSSVLAGPKEAGIDWTMGVPGLRPVEPHRSWPLGLSHNHQFQQSTSCPWDWVSTNLEHYQIFPPGVQTSVTRSLGWICQRQCSGQVELRLRLCLHLRSGRYQLIVQQTTQFWINGDKMWKLGLNSTKIYLESTLKQAPLHTKYWTRSIQTTKKTVKQGWDWQLRKKIGKTYSVTLGANGDLFEPQRVGGGWGSDQNVDAANAKQK